MREHLERQPVVAEARGRAKEEHPTSSPAVSSGNAQFSARRFIVSSRSRLKSGTTRPGFTLFRSRRAWTRYMTLARNPTLTPTAASRMSMP